MKARSFMLIAGETSGDVLAARLVREIRSEYGAQPAIVTPDYQPLRGSFSPRFFGAGGPRMAAEGVELDVDMTSRSVVGLWEVLKQYPEFRRLFYQLFRLAIMRQPDVIICVDFGGFNLRFAHAIRRHIRSGTDWFHPWNPKIIQYVSPQVWASRENRAYRMAEDYDLLLSIFAFEKDWYRKRVPRFRVEFVGHPMIEAYRRLGAEVSGSPGPVTNRGTTVVLLPGSRPGELRRHLPVMLGALKILQGQVPDIRARMVLPNERLVQQALRFGLPAQLDLQCGNLQDVLRHAQLAISKTGTITLDCAWFGVPTVALYKTSWSTYQVARRLVKVKYIAMPNLLADEAIIPEFIQDAATPENVAGAALELLRNEDRRREMKAKLARITASLGGGDASRRAARIILELLGEPVARDATVCL